MSQPFFLQLISDNLAARCFGKLVLENNDSRIFIRCGVLLNIGLNFLFELLGRLRAFSQDNGSLNDLTSYFIGSGRNAALKNIRKLHDNVLNLERSYTVARRFDNIVDTSDIPVEAVLISPCNVARMVKSVMPALGSLFFFAVLADKESAGNLVMLCLDNNLALLTYADALAVGVNYIDIKCRNRLAH